MDTNERIANIEISMESQRSALRFYIEMLLKNNGHTDYEKLMNSFIDEQNRLIKQHAQEDITELAQFYRLIMTIKPALLSILQPGQEFDQICDMIVDMFNGVLNRVRKQ
ncbi:MAG: hypothetical protein ACTSRD_03045, partial [Promethearchaeota archaeon]